MLARTAHDRCHVCQCALVWTLQNVTAHEMLTTEPEYCRCALWMYTIIEVHEVTIGRTRNLIFTTQSTVTLRMTDMSQDQKKLLSGDRSRCLQSKLSIASPGASHSQPADKAPAPFHLVSVCIIEYTKLSLTPMQLSCNNPCTQVKAKPHITADNLHVGRLSRVCAPHITSVHRCNEQQATRSGTHFPHPGSTKSVNG